MSDVNYQSFCDVDGLDLPGLTIDLPLDGIDASKYDDILKFSNARNIHIGRLLVRTGGTQKENAIDMNRNCENITIDEAIVDEGLQNALTVKGGCTNIHFGLLRIWPGKGHCNIELGNRSEQSQKKTTNVSFGHVERSDTLAVQVRAGHADWPTIGSGVVKRQVLASLLVCFYVWLARCFPFIP